MTQQLYNQLNNNFHTADFYFNIKIHKFLNCNSILQTDMFVSRKGFSV